jgi:hypothetical protein
MWAIAHRDHFSLKALFDAMMRHLKPQFSVCSLEVDPGGCATD